MYKKFILFSFFFALFFKDSKVPIKSSLHHIVSIHDVMPVKKPKLKKDRKKEVEDFLISVPCAILMGPSRIIFVDVGSMLLWMRSCNIFYHGMVEVVQTAWLRQELLQDCLPSVCFLGFRTFQFMVIQNR